jgi:tetratricopeptide (TPR) repeat protein
MTEPTFPQSEPVPPGVARLTGPLREALEEGMAHQRARRLREAEAAYRRALAEHPEQPDALNLLGALLVRTSGPREGIPHIRRAVELRPDDATFRSNLCSVFMQTGRLDEALKEIEAARIVAPESRDVAMNYAHLLRQLRRGAEAAEQYQRLLAADADYLPALVGLGKTYAELGDRERAAAAFRQAIARRPEDPAAHIELAAVQTFTTDAGEAAQMAALSGKPKIGPLDRVRLLHAAGKVADDLGRYDEAFGHYRTAKGLDRATYDRAMRSAVIDRLTAAFSPALFAAKRGLGDPSARPLFIVGMPRAGALLVERTLVGHPDIVSAGELESITQLALGHPSSGTNGAADQYPESVRDLTAEQARALAGRYLAIVDRVSPKATRVLDRMPHNFEHLGFIALLFPNARIIHCRRDPLDTCVACYVRHFSEGHGYNRDLAHLGHYYREYERLMAHWKSALPLPILELQYEDLVTEPERMSRALVEFTGLAWDERCLRAGELARVQGSVGRWRRYEKHLAPLREALGR